MTGAKQPSPGGTVLDRKIRSSVRGTLGWDKDMYTRYLRSISVAERRLLLNTYGEVCAVMASEYPQWSSNLMIEWNGDQRKSNYLSAYSLKLTPEPVQELASNRLVYLDLLYERLSFQERQVYGQLLSPGYLVSGAMPDIKAAYVLYKMQDLMQLEQYQMGERVDRMKALHLCPEVANVTDLAMHRIKEMLGELIDAPTDNNDSLFARLMLNTTVNRFCLELAEQSRLCGQAAAEMTALVRHLKHVFGDALPQVKNAEQVRELLAYAMDKPSVTTSWRVFKGRALTNVLARAEACADTDKLIAQFPEVEPFRWHYVLLTGLAVAWSYCTNDIFDTRLVLDNHRISEVINGRSQEDVRKYPPGLMLYHRRQFKLLWHSEQMYTLDFEKIKQEHADTQYLRDSMRDIISKFKEFTLAQWAGLDVKLLTLLKGSDWDQQERLVEEYAEK